MEITEKALKQVIDEINADLLKTLKTLLPLYIGTDKPSVKIVLEAQQVIKEATTKQK